MMRMLCSGLAALATWGAAPAAPAGDLGLLAGTGTTPPAPWHWVGLPGQTKPRTQYSVVELDDKRVLKIEARESYGNLVRALPSDTPPGQLVWRWRAEQVLARADLRQRSGDDRPLEVCALFDQPIYDVPFVERQVLRLARLRAHEELPGASVCYVWDGHLPTGTVLDSPFTRRVRIIVLRGADAHPHEWAAERRDLKADFLRLFGDETKDVPPLVGVLVSADTDNTHDHSVAYLADLDLE